MPLVLPLEKISRNSMMGACCAGYRIRLAFKAWIPTPGLHIRFRSALLLVWEGGRQLVHLCSLAMANTKATGSNRSVQELQAVLGHSWQRQQSHHSQRHLPAVSLPVHSMERSPSPWLRSLHNSSLLPVRKRDRLPQLNKQHALVVLWHGRDELKQKQQLFWWVLAICWRYHWCHWNSDSVCVFLELPVLKLAMHVPVKPISTLVFSDLSAFPPPPL